MKIHKFESDGSAETIANKFAEKAGNVRKALIIYWDEEEQRLRRYVTSDTLQVFEAVGLLESAKHDIIRDSFEE